jgi:DNA polymerase III alpha subunit
VIISNKKLSGLVPLVNHVNFNTILMSESNLNLFGLKKYDFLSLKEVLSFFKIIKEEKKIKLPFSCSQIDLKDLPT